MAALRWIFSRAGWDDKRRLESVAAGSGYATQSFELRSRRRAAVACSHGRVFRRVGAELDDELASNFVVRRGCIQPGGLDQPAANERRFAMNRKAFFLSFAAFLVSGVIFA